jgi:threonine synthase
MNLTCRGCNAAFPLDTFPHLCQDCGDLFGFQGGLDFSPEHLEKELPGIWRFRKSFSLPENAPVVTLGEGDTSLIWSEISGRKVGFKLESLNPTGSFKDRGTAVLTSWLLAAGISSVVEDSSGNAGGSFAAYASKAGISAKVFVPAFASGPKRTQIEMYGAEVISVPGPRSNAANAVLKEVEKGGVYASHAYLPQGTAGIATIAYELYKQIGQAPGTILLPVGHGSLLMGIALGFEALLRSGVITRLPRLVGIQAASCAPLWKAFSIGSAIPVDVEHKSTVAEGVAITYPYHGREVIAAVKRSEGVFLKVEEEKIITGQKYLAEEGIYVEPTSALIWNGLEQIAEAMPDPIVGIITGHGLKSN